MLRKGAHIAVALALLVTTTGLTGRVLCLGGDGHREIEVTDAPCCGTTAPADGPSLEARCSGGCVDTPLALSAVKEQSAALAPALAPVALAARSDGSASVWQTSRSPLARPAPSGPPRVLGTAVRLC